jgi:hypothetical protein
MTIFKGKLEITKKKVNQSPLSLKGIKNQPKVTLVKDTEQRCTKFLSSWWP